MIHPIYINRHAIRSDAEAAEIEKKTGRPVILILGEPRDAVLDIQEELRDKIAISAMNGMLSRDAYQGGWCPSKDEAKCGVKRLARFSYEYADAMLKARKS